MQIGEISQIHFFSSKKIGENDIGEWFLPKKLIPLFAVFTVKLEKIRKYETGKLKNSSQSRKEQDLVIGKWIGYRELT